MSERCETKDERLARWRAAYRAAVDQLNRATDAEIAESRRAVRKWLRARHASDEGGG